MKRPCEISLTSQILNIITMLFIIPDVPDDMRRMTEYQNRKNEIYKL